MPRLHLLPSRISKFSGEDTLAPANQEGGPPPPPPPPLWLTPFHAYGSDASVNIMFHGLINSCIHLIESHQLYNIHRIMNRKLKQWWSTIPPKSTKRTTYHLK
jgi:hypothetical protein